MRYDKLVFGLIAGLALLLGVGVQPAAAQPQPADGCYHIIADHADIWSYMSLDVPDWRTDPVWIQLYPYRDQANQQWRVTSLGNGFFQIANVNSGLVLDVPSGSLDSGVAIQQFPWNGGDNQQWRFDWTPPYDGQELHSLGFYRIFNKGSGLALDVPNGDYSVHNYIQQFTPHRLTGRPVDNQCWLLYPVSGS
jgi:hypothetical protein